MSLTGNIGKPIPRWGLSCPKCRRRQYYTCGRETCTCWHIPKGKLHQVVNREESTAACPYCGFTAHLDFWELRELEAAYDHH